MWDCKWKCCESLILFIYCTGFPVGSDTTIDVCVEFVTVLIIVQRLGLEESQANVYVRLEGDLKLCEYIHVLDIFDTKQWATAITY